MSNQPFGVRKFTMDVLPTGGMNTFLPALGLPPDKSPDLSGAVCKGTHLENFPRPQSYSGVSSTNPPDGYFIMRSGRRLLMCNGNFYVGLETDPSTLYLVASGVSTPGYKWSMSEWDNMVYMTNGYDNPKYYTPYEGTYGTLKNVGIASCSTYILVDYFQSDTGWTGGTLMDSSYWANPFEDGISRSNPPRSRKLTLSNPGSSVSMTRTFSPALNVSSFPSGYSLTLSDLFEFRTYHTKFNSLGRSDDGVAIQVDIYDGSNTWRADIYKVNLAVDKWGAPLLENTQPNFHEVWHRIPLQFFYNPSTNEGMTTPISSIQSVTFTVYSANISQGYESVDVFFDTCHIAKTPPIAASFAKEICSILSLSGGSVTTDRAKLDDMAFAGKIFKGESTTINPITPDFAPIDLTRWIHNYDGLMSDGSDEIVLTVHKTGSIEDFELRFYSGTNYWSKNLMGLIKDGKTTLYLKKDDFSTPAYWDSVTKVRFTIQFGAGTTNSLTISYLRMEPSRSEKAIVPCTGKSNDPSSNLSTVTQSPRPSGASYTYILKATSKTGKTGTFNLSGTGKENFTLFDDSTPSSDIDEFSWWMFHGNRENIDKLVVMLTDSSSNNVTYTVTRSMLVGSKTSDGGVTGSNISGIYSIKKSLFQLSGGSFDWSNVTTVSFILYPASNKNAAVVRIGTVKIVRGTGVSRPTSWKLRYVSSDGFLMDSQTTVWYGNGVIRSDPLGLMGAGGYISEIPSPPSSNVSKIEVYRQGTTGDYYLEDVIYRDQYGNFPTGIVVGRKDESQLGAALDPSQSQMVIGDGRYPVINGKYNLFNGGEQWVWGVSGYENYIFVSTPFYPFALSFDRCMRFAHEVMNVILINNSAFVFTKGGIVRVSGNDTFLYEHSEMPAGPACKGPSGTLFFVTERGSINLFDGSYPYNISKDVEESWKEYQAEDMVLSYYDDILYVSVASTPYRTLYAYYLPTKTWTVCNRYSTYLTNEFDLIPVGGYAGNMFFTKASVDSNTARVFRCNFINPTQWSILDIRTADLFGLNEQKYRVEGISVWADTNGTPNMTVEFYKDGTEQLNGESISLSPGIKEYRSYIYGRTEFNSDSTVDTLGTSIGVRLVSNTTNMIRIYKIRLWGHMLTEATNV